MPQPKLIPIPSGSIAEMTTSLEDGKIKVPIAKGVDLEKLLEGDEDPLFVTIDALTDTISGNKRRWTVPELHRVAEQVMQKKPDGYQGHLKAEDRSSKAPDAVTMWLGAKVATHKGKQRLFIKGYVLPKAQQFKDYIKRAKAANKNIAVSVYGQAIETWNEAVNAFEISDFNLESIDWARPGSEGVPNSGFLTLTTEMKEENEVDKKAILQGTTVSEMQENNPALVQEIQEAAKKDLETTVSEMTAALELEDSSKLVSTVSEMKKQNTTLQEQVAQGEVDRVLGAKVSNVAARKVLKKMVIGEMKSNDLKDVQETITSVLESDAGKALVAQFKAPVTPKETEDNRDGKSKSRFIKK